MKINKIIIPVFLSLIFIFGVNFVKAEDENEGDEDEYEYRAVEKIAPVEAPLAIPVAVTPQTSEIKSTIVDSQVVITTSQKSLVDSDNDGIVDSLDVHPGEDDFSFTQDVNNNGIVDDLEYLLNSNR